MSNLHYQVSIQSLHSHLIQVKLSVNNPTQDGQVLSLPAWIPGSYMIRDFAKNIVNIEAKDKNNQPLNIEKLDKQRWKIQSSNGPVHVEYSVYAFDLSVRSAYVCDEYVFFNGTSLFLEAEEQTHQAISVDLIQPENAHCDTWRVATTLSAEHQALHEFGRFVAQDYQALIDHPVLMGEFDLVKFHQSGVDFELVMAGGHHTDLNRINSDLSKLCAHHINLFGEPAPVDRYLFITMLSKNGYGGLEHSSSTALLFSRDDLPSVSDTDMTEGYQNFLSLCSHELFHTWHVKRIKPAELHGASLNHEAYTEQLWIYEGFTSFYDDISLARTGVVTPTQYLRVIGENLTRLKRNAGKHKQTITESSFYAWTKFYKQDASAINNIVSYYLKGGVIAMCLDLMLREQSIRQISLDDVMRQLWTEYGKPDKPTDPQAIHRIIKSLSLDFDAFLDMALYSTEDLPIDDLLKSVGVKVNYRPRANMADKGGKAEANVSSTYFGAQVSAVDTGVKITQVLDDSPARQAGLIIGDQLISVNHWQISKNKLQGVLDATPKDTSFTLHVLRDGKLKHLDMPNVDAVEDTVFLEIDDQSKFDSWMIPS